VGHVWVKICLQIIDEGATSLAESEKTFQQVNVRKKVGGSWQRVLKTDAYQTFHRIHSCLQKILPFLHPPRRNKF